MKRTFYRKALCAFLVSAVASSFIAGCSKPEAESTVVIESETTTAEETDLEPETEISETEVTETSLMVSDPTVPSISNVSEFLSLIKKNEGDEIPEDLISKKITKIYDSYNVVETYDYAEGKLMRYSIVDPHNNKDDYTEYEYLGGKLTKTTSKLTDYKGEPNDSVAEMTYEGDLLIKETSYWNGVYNGMVEYEYENGNMTGKTSVSFGHKYIYTYSYEDDLLISESFENVDYKFSSTFDLFYDENDDLIRSVYTANSEENNSVEIRTCEYEYDDEGVMTFYHCDFEGIHSADESYDDITYEYELEDGLTITEHSIEYDYYGNPTGDTYTRITRYDQYGYPISMTYTCDGSDEPKITRCWDNLYDDKGRLVRSDLKSYFAVDGDEYGEIVEYTYKN